MPKSRSKPSRQRNAQHLRQPPFIDTLPVPVYFRTEHMPSHATYPSMCHPWGEFVYSFSGITEVTTREDYFLAPPHMALWIAPGTEHVGFNHAETVHCSVYIERGLCGALPAQTCAVMVSPLVRAMLEHLRALPPEGHDGLESPTRSRLLRVLVDQLSTCATTGSYLPHADDPELDAVLKVFHDNPADNRPLAELASAFHMSERTLMRHAQRELGMSLTEWRARLRLVSALPLLQAGRSVESVALDLGYATSSAFIAMFRRLTGTSPGKFIARPANHQVSG
ncbi:AraC family transcriptional regulator [Paraburkholderia bannensis]|uniref:AraC family transcriptional regulator n=1 Tax=Paraburkholderia bannensis TaxID=765414 RepID=UPI002AB298CF|nr:helix-turn-helix transcriptional regulator [Paraburkholderia bannensis]